MKYQFYYTFVYGVRVGACLALYPFSIYFPIVTLSTVYKSYNTTYFGISILYNVHFKENKKVCCWKDPKVVPFFVVFVKSIVFQFAVFSSSTFSPSHQLGPFRLPMHGSAGTV